MERTLEDIIRGIVADGYRELSGQLGDLRAGNRAICGITNDLESRIADLNNRLGYLEAKLKTYEDAAPVNYDGPQFNRTVNTRGKPKIEFVEANGNKAYIFECNFPDAHEPSIKIGVEGFQNLAVRLTRTQVQDLLEIFKDFANHGTLDVGGKYKKKYGVRRPS